jgi:hypothetical protein
LERAEPDREGDDQPPVDVEWFDEELGERFPSTSFLGARYRDQARAASLPSMPRFEDGNGTGARQVACLA